MNEQQDILNVIERAFSSESGPARCSDPNHCDECQEADTMLLNLDPRDLNLEDLSSESKNWIFCFATDESIRWLTPGMIRVALTQDPPRPRLFFDLISQKTSDIYSDDQWIAILDLVDYCCDRDWLSRDELGYLGPGVCKNYTSEQAAPRNRSEPFR